MSVVRVILVGLGARSRIWRRVLDENPRTRIVGIVETNSATLAAAMEGRPGIVGGATLADVAGRVAADAVILVDCLTLWLSNIRLPMPVAQGLPFWRKSRWRIPSRQRRGI